MHSKFNWDLFGVAASVACAIHCALLPLLVSALTIFDINILHNAWFEWAMILLAISVGLYALIHGYRKHHRKKIPVILFSAGAALLVCKQIWHEYEIRILAFAVVLICSAHLLNLRYSRWHAGSSRPAQNLQ